MSKLIYKVSPQSEWATAQRSGTYEGSADDRRDGFIHFSTADQLATTLAKHFAGQVDLVLVTVKVDQMGESLRWEPSRGGDLFPHLYGALAISDVLDVQDLPPGSDGHVIAPLGTS